jgi:hypothetical protein
MQNDTPAYETDAQRLRNPKPDEADGKLGSAQPDVDPLDAVAGLGPAGMPREFFAAESRPNDAIPLEALPIETQPTDFMTGDERPKDFRPREVFPTEQR